MTTAADRRTTPRYSGRSPGLAGPRRSRGVAHGTPQPGQGHCPGHRGANDATDTLANSTRPASRRSCPRRTTRPPTPARAPRSSSRSCSASPACSLGIAIVLLLVAPDRRRHPPDAQGRQGPGPGRGRSARRRQGPRRDRRDGQRLRRGHRLPARDRRRRGRDGVGQLRRRDHPALRARRPAQRLRRDARPRRLGGARHLRHLRPL